jgi:hypothetical protein
MVGPSGLLLAIIGYRLFSLRLGKKRKAINSGYGKYCSIAIYQKSQQFNKRSMAGTITRETKREGQTKAKRRAAHRNHKKGER